MHLKAFVGNAMSAKMKEERPRPGLPHKELELPLVLKQSYSFAVGLKGIVHPKTEHSIMVYSPSCCSKPL